MLSVIKAFILVIVFAVLQKQTLKLPKRMPRVCMFSYPDILSLRYFAWKDLVVLIAFIFSSLLSWNLWSESYCVVVVCLSQSATPHYQVFILHDCGTKSLIATIHAPTMTAGMFCLMLLILHATYVLQFYNSGCKFSNNYRLVSEKHERFFFTVLSVFVDLASSQNLWISGLSSLTRATDLKAVFSKHGKVRDEWTVCAF